MTRMCRSKIAGGAKSLRGSTGTLERLALLCRASLVLICATSATSKVKRLLLQDMCLPQMSCKHCGQSSQNPSMKECTGSQIVLFFCFTVHLFSDGPLCLLDKTQWQTALPWRTRQPRDGSSASGRRKRGSRGQSAASLSVAVEKEATRTRLPIKAIISWS